MSLNFYHLKRLTKEHIAIYSQTQIRPEQERQVGSQNNPQNFIWKDILKILCEILVTLNEAVVVQKLILSVFEIIKPKISSLSAESRKALIITPFGVVQLIEKSENGAILESIIDGISDWLENDTVLNNKERATLMTKLYQNLTKRLSDLSLLPSNDRHFDKEKLEELNVKYLHIVFKVYQSERLRTVELDRGNCQETLIAKLEASYLWGLSHPKTRKKFFSLYCDWVPRIGLSLIIITKLLLNDNVKFLPKFVLSANFKI